jgi:hypothetical protein
MKRIFVFGVLISILVGCDKDKVESKPHLSFKSFNSDVVPSTGLLRVTLEFTDQEGDLDSIFITRRRLNQRGTFYSNFFYNHTPEFGNQNRGELELNLDIAQELIFNVSALRIPGSNPERYEPDTLQLRFYIKDKAGHVSDTTSPKQLIVIR